MKAIAGTAVLRRTAAAAANRLDRIARPVSGQACRAPPRASAAAARLGDIAPYLAGDRTGGGGAATTRPLSVVARRPAVVRCFSSAAAAPSADAANAGEAPPPVSGGTDHFSALGLTPAYDLGGGAAALKSKYRSLMSELHPDKHAGVSPDEKEQVGGKAAAVTRAYDVLSDDMLRAEHLLEIRGLGLDERDGVELVGPELLMEVMELRESIDSTASDLQLKILLDETKEHIATAVDELSQAFQDDDYDEARKLTAKLRYRRRIRESIVEKIETME